jgi:hypothetical protein
MSETGIRPSTFGRGFECDHCGHFTQTLTGAKRHEAKCNLRGGTVREHTWTVEAIQAFGGPHTRLRCSCATGQEGLLLMGWHTSREQREYVNAILSLHRSTGASLLDVVNGDA